MDGITLNSKEKFAALIANSTDVISIVDQNGVFLYVSPSFERIFDYESEELIGENGCDYIHPDDRSIVKDLFGQMIERSDRTTERAEFRFRHADGSWRWLEAVGSNRTASSIDGYVINAREITARRRTEERYRQFIEHSSDVLNVLDESGINQYVSPSVTRHLGYEPEDLVGESPFDYVHPDDVEEMYEEFQQGVAVPEYETTFEYRFRHADGSWVWLESRGRSLPRNPALEGRIVVNTRDITERKRQEQQIRYRNDELRQLNEITRVLSTIARKLLTVSDRSDIEETVCNRLRESSRYSDAWIVEHSPRSDEPLRTVVENQDDNRLKSLLRDEEVCEALTRISQDGIQVVTAGSLGKSDSKPVQSGAGESQRRSTILLPLGYGKTVYGVLIVQAANTDAFGEYEQQALEVLAEIIGFAINAIRHRKILHEDTVQELRIETTDSSSVYATLSDRLHGQITHRGMVPRDETSSLQYAEIEGTKVETALETLSEQPGIASPRCISEGDTGGQFEWIGHGQSMIELLVEYGASIQSAQATEGTVAITAHLPPTVNVRACLDTLFDAFPESTLKKKQLVESPTQTSFDSHHQAVERLTDRQWTVLQTAYLTGYFEYPRQTTAEELADSLDIASSTLYQHLQRALSKTLDVIFE